MGKLREHMAVLIGVVALAPYGIVRFALAARVRIAAEEWAQYTYLLKGVEAIALAAVGFLFGKAVNLMRVEAAEARVKDAQQHLRRLGLVTRPARPKSKHSPRLRREKERAPSFWKLGTGSGRNWGRRDLGSTGACAGEPSIAIER